MELRKEWFEPGPDSVSPFEREWHRTGKNDFGGCISAAFRALLAGEDVGRTADAKDAEIARLRAEVIKQLEQQLAAERARVVALVDVIHDANGIAYPFKEMQDKMTFILNALTQGDEQ